MKINSGQAPSTLIPEYIGSAFDKVVEVADNIEYVKDVATGIAGLPVQGYIGSTPPLQPRVGAEWYCTTDGRTYVWYKDNDSGQWVESSPQSTVETDPSIADNVFALWKRSAAEAGLNLVVGSFEEGGVLTSSSDVLLHKESKSIYAWAGVFPHTVAPGTNPAAIGSGYVSRTNVVLRNQLADDNSTVEIGQSIAGNLGKRTAGAVFVTEAPFNADPTGVVDATAAINAALATGKNVYGAGIFKVSGPLTMSGFGQQLCVNFPGSYLLPYHDGDVVRMTLHSQGAHVVIRGRDSLGNLTQPRTGSAGGAVVIGYNGGNCTTASVAGSYVHTFYGNGYVHEQGAMVDFTGAHAENCTLDGFQWTPNYDNNNHALINTTHAVNCGRDGYSLLSTGNLSDDKNPRHHQFLNAKAFGCQRNFNIETHGNVGTVFSKLGVAADRFGPLAYGNSISVFETVASFLGWQDLGTRNTLYGIDNNSNWTARQSFSRKHIINSGHEGYLTSSQTADREWTENISDTSYSMNSVIHKTSTGGRRDVWQGGVSSDNAWFSYWRADGSNADMGYKAVFKEGAPKYANGFVIAPDNKNGFIGYGIGTKDSAYWGMYSAGVLAQTITPTAVLSGADNAISLGDATHRYSTVYAGTGSINTSDEREKTFIDVSEAEIAAARQIKAVIRKFQFNDAIETKGADKARYHFGVGAQTVWKILEDNGLDPSMYAFVCHDEWEDEFVKVTKNILSDSGEIIDTVETGEIIQTRTAGDRYGIRYDELCMFMLLVL